jgi:hypothetical protein
MRSEYFEETVALFRDVIGVPVAREADGLVGLTLGDGTVLELYGPEEEFHDFFTTGPVVGFKVDDFDKTRAAMVAAGIAFIGEPECAYGTSWQHFYCPDGTVAEIIGQGALPPGADAENSD